MPKVLVRAIRARGRRSDFDTIIKEVERAIDQVVKPGLISEFNDYTSDWETDISFGARKTIDREEIKIYVFPQGEGVKIFNYVSKGTQPHKIEARNAPALSFKWGGPGSNKPKTFPYGNQLRLGSGGVVKQRFFTSVEHPGIEPRFIEKQIGDKYNSTFKRVVENAFRRGTRQARIAIQARSR